VRKFISVEAEFYLGLLTTLLVAFLIPMLVSIKGSTSPWPFLGYLYLPVGMGIIIHASVDTLDPKEKESLLSSLGILGQLLYRKEKETK
jgi:peptidoglycan/LPS O-acetylase OafA/YrhL